MTLAAFSFTRAAAFLALAGLVWIALVDNPDGGRAVARTTIGETEPRTTGSIAAAPVVPAVNAPAADAAPKVQDVAFALPRPPAAAERRPAALPELLEDDPYVPLPRVSPEGLRPLDAYARPAAAGQGAPRIVLVVGGLGISQTGTQKAIRALPDDVTLAFAASGSSLRRWVTDAREKGHEVLLQVPLEPVGYPAVDPGPHTLLASAGVGGEDLSWALGRMTSYAGVMNHMGARFLAEDAALRSFLGELARRGLLFLDDGSTSQSLSRKVGDEVGAPVLVADLTVDEARAPAEIAKALARLEEIARAKGIAVGVASAFPATVEAIVAWAPLAAQRGVALVPASAGLSR